MEPNNKSHFIHKTIPKSIVEEAKMALSYYPELNDIPIEFKFKDVIKKSTMQAQPTWPSLLKSKNKRKYVILISRKFHIEKKGFNIGDMEKDVLIGWFGHELGHILDYSRRSTMNMILFGLKYLFSKKHLKEIERTADLFAVNHGMSHYILATKDFILNNIYISEMYKARIERLYMSAEEIMEIVNSEEKTLEKEVDKEIEKKIG